MSNSPINQIPLWNPGLAGVLSFLIPGLGQIYRTKILAGFLWGVFTIMGYFCLVVPGLILHIACICNAVSGNRFKEPNTKEEIEDFNYSNVLKNFNSEEIVDEIEDKKNIETKNKINKRVNIICSLVVISTMIVVISFMLWYV